MSCSHKSSPAPDRRRALRSTTSAEMVPDTSDRDRGAGLFSTSFGILFFLGFLFFAVQLLFNLYATSVVTSATYDAARMVATSPHHPATQADLDDAVAHARTLLGSYADRATFEW